MGPKNEHKRVLLNRNQSGQVDYCDGCEVVEIAVGPVSVRLHSQDLQLFSTLIQGAVMRLEAYSFDREAFAGDLVDVESMLQTVFHPTRKRSS